MTVLMDLDEYLPMFLAECREHLQELNLAIVSLEQTPDDRERVDEVFRIAHSLKGMSATMGFARIAALTHEMEDVLELLRQRRGGLQREAIDTLLECLDILSTAVESIDEAGAENIEPEALIERLRSLARQSDEPMPPHAEVAGPATVEPPDAGSPVATAVGVTISVTLAEDIAMPAVRAYMVIAALAEHGQVISSVPAEDALDDFQGQTIEVVLHTEHEEAVLAAAAAAVEGVQRVVTDGGSASSPDGAATEPGAPTPVGAGSASAAPGAPDVREAPAPRTRKPTSTVRVDADRLDQLMSSMGELVVNRTQLESLVLQSNVLGIQQAMQDLTRSSQALRAMVMQVRMIEVEAVFLRLPRLVRDLTTKLEKQVELVLTGADTELDRSVVDALGDPLVHLVRNALDHGFEPPDARVAAGKPATGTLEISARHAGGSVVITVADDGRGVDPVAVGRKAAERGLIAPGEDIDLPRAIELLFSAGFSTADQTSDISGRGVGMDAVRDAVRSLGGEVYLTSVLGEGTTAQIRLPLTLAIMSALLVESGGLPFAVPLDRVERTLRFGDHVVRSAAGRRLLVVGDEVLPICDGAQTLGCAPSGAENTHAVVVRAGEQRLALAVEHLIGQRELVTRPLPPELAAHATVSGGAVLSDGGIALIIDCDSLMQAANVQVASALAAA
jgi:two-component system chemotaxis sensor kinase CheA